MKHSARFLHMTRKWYIECRSHEVEEVWNVSWPGGTISRIIADLRSMGEHDFVLKKPSFKGGVMQISLAREHVCRICRGLTCVLAE
jgi:hypothetical protein